MIERTKVVINTEKQFTALDDIIHDFIKDKKGRGLVNVFVAHTTCAIKVLEGELLLLADINNYLDKTFPKEGYYMHDKIEIREAEPYSYCQFIMGKDHSAHGRARHPFMTGSGGWAYFSATRYILGMRPGFETLEIDPCVPADWSGFSMVRRWRGVTYEIEVSNPDGVMKGVKERYLDGKKVERIPLMEKGTVHQVRVVMGKEGNAND